MLDVKTFGAKGDGNTDDTAAIQAALTQAATAGGDTVYFPASTYRITDNLFVYNPNPLVYQSLNLLGDGGSTLLLDAVPAQLYPGFSGWINLGIESLVPQGPGQPPIPKSWSGRISGLRFVASGNVNRGVVILVCHNCIQFVIENNFFDLSGFPLSQQAPIPIECPGYPPTFPGTREHGIIRGNWVLGNQLPSGQGGTEGMGLVNASYITFENNDIRGSETTS